MHCRTYKIHYPSAESELWNKIWACLPTVGLANPNLITLFLLYYVPSMIIIWFFFSFQLFGSILESFRKDFNLASQTHIILFPYFLYPINQVAISGKKVYTDMYYVFAFAWWVRIFAQKIVSRLQYAQYPQNQNVCLTNSSRETLPFDATLFFFLTNDQVYVNWQYNTIPWDSLWKK